MADTRVTEREGRVLRAATAWPGLRVSEFARRVGLPYRSARRYAERIGLVLVKGSGRAWYVFPPATHAQPRDTSVAQLVELLDAVVPVELRGLPRDEQIRQMATLAREALDTRGRSWFDLLEVGDVIESTHPWHRGRQMRLIEWVGGRWLVESLNPNVYRPRVKLSIRTIAKHWRRA